ncbi:hypothetical protein DL897_04335 [Thermoflavimicrobium daqui]|uniref:Uncharacterized protein n=1 Tax=Thermoflavimicrobium daqui TaxID=2137476 RepID=A0A364K7G2_9BACL|nr:hypothetical protein DL897_04335 [Thermoflavimicrobium daqui]
MFKLLAKIFEIRNSYYAFFGAIVLTLILFGNAIVRFFQGKMLVGIVFLVLSVLSIPLIKFVYNKRKKFTD